MRSASLQISILLLVLPFFSALARPSPVGGVLDPEILANTADATSASRPSSSPSTIAIPDRPSGAPSSHLAPPPKPLRAAVFAPFQRLSSAIGAPFRASQLQRLEALEKKEERFYARQRARIHLTGAWWRTQLRWLRWYNKYERDSAKQDARHDRFEAKINKGEKARLEKVTRYRAKLERQRARIEAEDGRR